MAITDRAAILRYHRARVASFGRGTSAALGWKTPRSQTARFEVLAEIGDLNGHSVLDVGCGHGDLRAFLGERYPHLHYLGIDHFEPFLEVGYKRYAGWPNTRFLLGDFTTARLPQVDYVVASGSLGYRSQESDFVVRMIDKLYSSCQVALGFNLLRHIPDGETVLAAYDPEPIANHCQRLASRVSLREGYLQDDFTVFLYR
jgi:trans-aconitate methyltransferase